MPSDIGIADVYLHEIDTMEEVAPSKDRGSSDASADYYLKQAYHHLKNRATLRDSPEGERSMATCVEAFNAVTGKELTETEGWMFMIQLKLARSRNGKYHEDDYEDIVAYAALMAESAMKEHIG